MGSFNEDEHPRGHAGKFVKTDNAGAGQLGLSDDEKRYGPLDENGHLAPEGLLRLGQDLGRQDARSRSSRGLPTAESDDVASKIMLEVLRMRRANQAEGNGQTVRHNDIHVARFIARRIGLADLARPEDRQGFAIYSKALGEQEETLGRPLRASERDELAHEVRMQFPPSGRPSTTFHRPMRAVSVEGREVAVEEAAAKAASGVNRDASVAAVERAYDALEEDGRHGGRRRAWDAIAARTGGPSVSWGSLSEQRAAAVRKAVTEGDQDVVDVARSWQAGELGPAHPGVRAMVAPFGPEADPDEVARTITAFPSFGAELWDGAISAATRSRQRSE